MSECVAPWNRSEVGGGRVRGWQHEGQLLPGGCRPSDLHGLSIHALKFSLGMGGIERFVAPHDPLEKPLFDEAIRGSAWEKRRIFARKADL